jgi:hypothetical protein
LSTKTSVFIADEDSEDGDAAPAETSGAGPSNSDGILGGILGDSNGDGLSVGTLENIECFYNSSTIFLQFFYDYSLRAFTVFSARNPSQPEQGKSFPEYGMHQILLQFFYEIAVESVSLLG